MSPPDHLFRYRLAPRHIDDEAGQEVPQVEASVEPVGESSQVSLAVLAVLQRVERAGQRGLEVAQHGIDPLELGQVPRLEGAHHPRQVNTACFIDGGKAAQTVAEDDTAGLQAGLGPLADGLGREAAEQIELQPCRPTGLVQRQRRHERHLVLRAAARLATRALSTEVGVVQLDRAGQLVSGLLIGHRAVDLLVEQPRRGVAHSEIALERQRRHPGLGLADEMYGQEPGGQRQLGVFHHRAGRHRCLVPAADALEELSGALADEVVPGAVAAPAAEPVRPARTLQCFHTLRFGAKVTQELGDRHAGLELDLVAGHRGSPWSGELRLRGQRLIG